jgi:cell division protease FtsH
MVISFGMSDKLGPRTFGHKQELVFLGREISEQKDYSDKTAKQIDDEVRSIIEEAHATAERILAGHKAKLVQLAERLIAQETIEGAELDEMFQDIVPKPVREIPKVTPTPVPIEPAAEAVPEEKPKKAPGVPRLIPKQSPASPE